MKEKGLHFIREFWGRIFLKYPKWPGVEAGRHDDYPGDQPTEKQNKIAQDSELLSGSDVPQEADKVENDVTEVGHQHWVGYVVLEVCEVSEGDPDQGHTVVDHHLDKRVIISHCEEMEEKA